MHKRRRFTDGHDYYAEKQRRADSVLDASRSEVLFVVAVIFCVTLFLMALQ